MPSRNGWLSLRLGDYRRVLLAALEPVAHPVALLTVTPPGHAALPPDGDAFRLWNRTAAKRWAKLDRRAKQRLRRAGLRVTPIARVAQRQRRGLDHVHLVLLVEGLADRRAIAAYVQALRELGPEHGFGFVDDPFKRRRNARTGKLRDMVYESATVAARYLCGYLVESDQLAAMVAGRDHSFRALWVAPALTRASGVNCRRLRRVRHAWVVVGALKQGSRPTLPAWWQDIGERASVLRLLRLEDRGPPAHAAPA